MSLSGRQQLVETAREPGVLTFGIFVVLPYYDSSEGLIIAG